jgi:putative glutamine amidotransferase
MLFARAGGRPIRQAGHAGTLHGVRTTQPTPWDWPSNFQVRSHHDWVITKELLPPSVQVVAEADDGTVEAFSIAGRPEWGIMWHPEREAPDGFARRALRHIGGA